MAARRLITVLIVLLVLSSVAAALVPIERQSSESTTTTTTRETTTTAAGGRFVQRTVDASTGEPATIRIRLGDRLGLDVHSRRAAQVGVPAFGELEEVDPASPAHFDLLPFREGRYPVRLLMEGRPTTTIATIVVAKQGKRSGKHPGDDRAGARSKRARPAS